MTGNWSVASIRKGIIILGVGLWIAVGGSAAKAEDNNFTYLSPQQAIYWTPTANFAPAREQWSPAAGQVKIAQPWSPPPGFKAPTEVWAAPPGWGEIPEWKPEPDFRGKIIRE